MKWAAKTRGSPSRPARIAYYCVENHHSQTYIRAMKDSAPAIGVELVKIYVSPGSKRDFETAILENIKDNIDLVLTHMVEPQVVLWVKDAARLGYKGKQLHRTLTASLIPMIGRDLAQGLYGVYPTATFEETEVPGIKLAWEFQKKYHPEFMDTERGYWYGRYAVIILLAQQAAEQVIEEKGFENLNGNNIVKVLESGRKFTAMGLIPPFHFSKEYHGGIPTSVKIGEVKGEKLIPVTDWIESIPKTSQQLTLDYYK
jgi:ABC-type branched-subunit amino acid transport system substrate-binding protein